MTEPRQVMRDYSLQATYYRTALLLGTVSGAIVHRWAEEIIQADPAPPRALLDVVSVGSGDLSALRHALWPLVIEPDPAAVLEAVLAGLGADLASGRRGLQDTVTILHQLRSQVRMPRVLYDGLNSALVAYSIAEEESAVARWLQQFAAARPPT